MKEREPEAHQQLELTYDDEYRFHGLWTDGGICRVRIFEGQGAVPVIIATELPANENTSVTNMAEYLAAEILEQHLPHRIGSADPLIWIEHYPERRHGAKRAPEAYDLVRFERVTPTNVWVGGHWRRSLGQPTWRHLEQGEVAQLIGKRLGEGRP
jgi:hypothetical protein